MSQIEYKEGDHNEFINYLYSNSPKNQGSIKLELPLLDKDKNIGLHIFEQLLMIFVDGLKYFYGKDNKVNINELNEDNIKKVNEYFISMNYKVKLEVFKDINSYVFKFPNYFKDQKHITKNTLLEDFYYEIYYKNNNTFRISFIKIE